MCHDAIVVSYVSWRHCGIVIINFDVLKDLIYHEEYFRNGKINIRMIVELRALERRVTVIEFVPGFLPILLGGTS